MLKSKEALEILKKITYKPEWHIECYIRTDYPGSPVAVDFILDAIDPVTKAPTRIMGHSRIDPFMFKDKEALLAFIFDRLIVAERHETQEWFRYEGKPVYDPHGNETKL